MKTASLSFECDRNGVRYENWLTVLLAGGLWLVLINALRVEWSVNQQYSYGWVVPLLSLYLFWERWKDAPPPGRALSSTILSVFAGICAFSFLPWRLLLEANPDWRLPDWGLALAVVGLCFAALLYAGGWSWLRHFGFPIGFFLVAVPWPVPLEQNIMQHLMRGNAWMSVQALVWCGLPALQHGNVIQIPNGVVGIDEACSGVRSLQTTLMISLFLGELYRFTVRRRGILLAAAVGFALLCNLGRTFFLVWLSAARGIHEMTKWHDAAGLTVLVVCVGGLWEMAHLFRSRDAARPTPGEGVAAGWGFGRRLPGKALAGLALWFILSEAATELWYRSHEWNREKSALWSVDWPVTKPDFRDTEIAETTKVILKYNEGRAGRWMDADGSQWTMFFFRWFPGRASAQLAKGHKPDICLPAAGLHLDEYLGVKDVKAGPITLPFRSYIFDYNGKPLHVFYCLWEDRQEQAGSGLQVPEDRKAKTRLLAVMAGKRNLGQQVLEITISGFESEDEAFDALRQKIASLIKV